MNQLSIFANSCQSILTYDYDLFGPYYTEMFFTYFFSAQVLAFLFYSGSNNDQKFIGH